MTITHRMSSSPEWRCWANMRYRCRNHNHHSYARYGGRGISVCSRWSRFTSFLQDMGPRPSGGLVLDRIDNEKGYFPGNCRWTTYKTNNRNRTPSSSYFFGNRILKARGRSQCLAAWAEEAGISGACLSYRIKHGWSIEKALSVRPNALAKEIGRAAAEKRRIYRIRHDGKTLSIREACALTGVKEACAYKRISRYGWPLRLACGFPTKETA